MNILRRIIPTIIARITGKKRYLPVIEWSSKLWTYNIFRFYEMIFGRKVGIAVEMTSTAYRYKGKVYVTYQAWSFESKIALCEQVIREMIISLSKLRTPRIVLVYDYMPMYNMGNSLRLPAIVPSPYRFAIAFDSTSASTSPGSSTSPLTWTHTCTGSNLFMAIGAMGESASRATAVSYNSVSATQIGTFETDSAGNSEQTFWRLFAPSTGANTVSVTHNAGNTYCVSTSYSGVNQSALDSNAQGHTTVDATSYAKTTTVVASNCWLVGCASTERDAGCGTLSMSVGTLRGSSGNIRNTSSQFGGIVGDSNGTVGTGAQSLTFNSTTSNHWTTNVISIAPSGNNYTTTPTETVTVTDTRIMSVTRAISETITNTDTFIKNTLRTITESITNTDTFSYVMIFYKELSETVTNVDTVLRDIVRNISETVTNNDVINKITTRIVSETTTITDAITTLQVKLITLYESLTLIEDFRMFLNSRVARWRDKYNESKTQDWVEKQDL